MKLSEILAERAEVEIAFAAGTLKVGYRPMVFTDAFWKEMDELSVPAGLARMIADWDLEGEDGKPAPITEEYIAGLPWILQRELNRQIQGRVFPNLLSGAAD